mmetsp:Transcript_74577/g.218448  ORF Transcript_74577/g.218448 Transcript_74577/m.218448 type:complete len:106 (+) Transcript_74577:62-379(+)
MAGSQRSRATVIASLLALAALLAVAQTTVNFVGPASGVQGSSAVTRQAKSLFDATKKINSKVAEANGENEYDNDTDETWAIAYVVAGLGATWLFISVLYSMKPGA